MFLKIADCSLEDEMFSGCDFWTNTEEGRGSGLQITRIPPFVDAVEITAFRACHVYSRSSSTKKSWGSVQAERARGGLSGLCPTVGYILAGLQKITIGSWRRD